MNRTTPQANHSMVPTGALPVQHYRRLNVEADELWSFVGKKVNKKWLWLALDAKTRQVLAFHVGDRSGRSAKKLWNKSPAVYRQCATFYTDAHAPYAHVIPKHSIE